MTLLDYTKSYGEMMKRKEEQMMNKPNLKLFRITTKYGYTTEVLASSKKDARRLSRLSKIESIDAVG